jgi:hypothetical protein
VGRCVGECRAVINEAFLCRFGHAMSSWKPGLMLLYTTQHNSN